MNAARRLLTVEQAAARVSRSRRQIETWIAEGLTVHRLPGSRIRYVVEGDLLDEYRRRLAANPNRRRPRHAHGDEVAGTTSQS